MDTRALRSLSYGMYVIESRSGDRTNAQIANTVFQVTSEPTTLAVSINKQNMTHQLITDTGAFSVAVLAEDTPLKTIGQFGFRTGRETDKLAGIAHEYTPCGLPYPVEHVLAWFEAGVDHELDMGSHTLFVATVTEAAVMADGVPMTYAYYHQVKRGGVPTTAPTHIAARTDL